MCDSCSAVLDASDASLRVLQQQERQVTVTPLLTLGSRGTWRGVSWEMIGFQVVTITVDGADYSWSASARHYVELYQKLVGVGASATV